MKPLKSSEPYWRLLSPRFRYVPSSQQTVEHLREVFERARNRLTREHMLNDNVRKIK